MYQSLWTLLVLISLAISVAAFFWGLSAGQFTNAQRARYLPFTDDEPGPAESAGSQMKIPLEVYVLGTIIVISLLVLAAPVILTFYNVLTG